MVWEELVDVGDALEAVDGGGFDVLCTEVSSLLISIPALSEMHWSTLYVPRPSNKYASAP